MLDAPISSSPSPQYQSTLPPLLEVRDLSVGFESRGGLVPAVEGVSLDVNASETVGLVGESGCGKSVSALAIMGLVPSYSSPSGRVLGGSVRLAGRELIGASRREVEAVRGREMAMVFQDATSSLNPAFTVGEQLAEVARIHLSLGRKDAWKLAIEKLQIVGIPAAAKRVYDYPHTFSGGMRQRAMIAMALMCDPAVIIADEPTTALDVTVQARILELLLELQSTLDMSILLITHDLAVVAEVCDRVVVMYAGQVVESGPVDTVFASPQHPYTEGLLRSMPQTEWASGELPTIPGTVPTPGEMPVGCRFHPRCSYSRTPACTSVPIPLEGDRQLSVRCVRSSEIVLHGVGI